MAGVVVPDEEGVISDGEDVGTVNGDGPCSTVTFSCCSTLSTDFMGVVDFLSRLPEVLLPLYALDGGVGGVVDWVLAELLLVECADIILK